MRAGAEEGNRVWDGCMTSLTQRTWIWANSGRQWKTGKPGVLKPMRSQRVRHDLVTEKQNFLVRSVFTHHLLWVHLLIFLYCDLLEGLNISCILSATIGFCQSFIKICPDFCTKTVYTGGSIADHHCGLKCHLNCVGQVEKLSQISSHPNYTLVQYKF